MVGRETKDEKLSISDHIIKCHEDPLYRIENNYFIIDKQSRSILFKLNPQQLDIFQNKHNRNLVLKARQIGSTTFWCIYLLDKAIWNDNQTIGIISHSIESAQGIFRRIRYAVDNMHPELKKHLGVKQDSARQLVFGNNSLIRVDTTMRGETLSGLLVSEYGKICARWPQKSEEVMTGSLQTLSSSAEVVIESTAEGADGYFWELCQKAMARGNEGLSSLEFKLHFYPWWSFSDYTMENV